MAAAATALNENTKCTQFSRCLHQTSRDIPASVKHAAAFIDQTMVIQLIWLEPATTSLVTKDKKAAGYKVPSLPSF